MARNSNRMSYCYTCSLGFINIIFTPLPFILEAPSTYNFQTRSIWVDPINVSDLTEISVVESGWLKAFACFVKEHSTMKFARAWPFIVECDLY